MYELRGPEERVAVAVTRDSAGRVGGVTPLRVGPSALNFRVGANTLGAVPLRKLWLAGGQPGLPPRAALHDALFHTLTSAFPDCDCIGLSPVAADDFLWDYLHTSDVIRRHFLVYAVDGVCPYHTLPLPASFEAYLGQYSAKKRYNLKRQVRLLREHGQGNLELRRATAPADVPALFEAAASLARKAGRARHSARCLGDSASERRHYTDLAARGLLRSYWLECGGRPVACALGLQYRETYTVEATRFDPELARLSPGTSLLHLMAEDLIRHGPVRLIDLGFGSPQHRQDSTNVVLPCAAVLLLRHSLGSVLLRAGHSAFRFLVRSSRRLLKKGAPDAGPGHRDERRP
jgi:hypothetical protein